MIINEYVVNFLTNMGTEEMINMWQSNENQSKLKKALTEKKIKDPEKPKAACTAYIFFTMDERPKIVNSDPTMKPTDIMKEMAVRWSNLRSSSDAEDKKKLAYYEAKAAEDKKRAAQERESYVAPSQEVLKQRVKEKTSSGSKARAKRDPTKPKGATTAWLLYCQEHREGVKSEGFSGRDVTRVLGERWKKFQGDPENADKLDEYKARVLEDKERFKTEMKEYTPLEKVPTPVKSTVRPKGGKKKSAPVDESDSEATDIDSDDESSDSDSDSEAEVAPPPKSSSSPKKVDPRLHYMKVMRPLAKKKYPNAKAAEISKYLAAWWKDVSKEDREMWRQRAEAEK